MKPNPSSAPEATSPWAASILPGQPFAPAAVPQATFAGPAQPAAAPVPMAPAVSLGYPMSAPGRVHRGRAGTSRTTVLLVVAVVVALAAGGYYEAPKLLASKKAPTAAPVAHHVDTPGAAVPSAAAPVAAPGAAVPGAAVPGAAVPGAATATAAGGAKTSPGVTLPATLNGMPKLTDPASVAAAAAFLASTADNLLTFKENSSAALYRLNPTTVVTVAATVNPDVTGGDWASIDHDFAAFLLPGSADLKPTPVVGAASPAWIECKTFTDLGNASAENPNAKPATTCGYVSAAVFAAIVVPSPRGADETTVAMAIGKQLH